MFNEKNLITAVQALILSDDQLLIVREGHKLLLPGGKPEPGETNEIALARELKEELDCTINTIEYFGTYEYEKGPYTDKSLRLICYIVSLCGEPKASSEINEIIWLDKQSYKSDPIMPHVVWDRIFADLKQKKNIDLV